MVDGKFDLDGFLPFEKIRPGRIMVNKFKHVDELGNAQDFIEAMELDVAFLTANKDDPPDAIYQLDNRRIGIELTLCGVTHPNQRRELWDRDTFVCQLQKTIDKKNAHRNLGNRVERFDELWLFVMGRGSIPTSAYVDEFVKDATFSAVRFSQIWLQLDYEPNAGGGRRPIYQLK